MPRDSASRAKYFSYVPNQKFQSKKMFRVLDLFLKCLFNNNNASEGVTIESSRL